MPFHWLDSNVFIQAKNGPYSFGIAPTFWKWIVKSAEEGLIRSPQRVHQELKDYDDQLARWAKMNGLCGLFVNPDAAVLKCYGAIAVFVQKTYKPPQAKKFLSGADTFLVAHAMSNSGTVVTHEVLVDASAADVKIPNVCENFSVKWKPAYEALEKLGLKL